MKNIYIYIQYITKIYQDICLCPAFPTVTNVTVTSRAPVRNGRDRLHMAAALGRHSCAVQNRVTRPGYL